MAVLYVSEYTSSAFSGGQLVNIAQEPSAQELTVSIAGSSTASSAFKGQTNIVRLHTDAACCIQFGSAPVATTSMKRLAANQTEYFDVSMIQKVSGSCKVACITVA